MGSRLTIGHARRWRGATLVSAVAAGLVALAVPAGLARAEDTCPGNLLTNPGFEGGFTARGRLAELVANGWQAWYKTLPGVDGINYAPAYLPRRRDDGSAFGPLAGLWSQEQATDAATHTGGLWQHVAVPPGSALLASARAYAWASNGPATARSQPYGRYRVQVGVDPYGGADPAAARVRWSEPITITDAWVPLQLEVPISGDAVTFFTRGEALDRLAHNVSRWDEACLRVLGPAGVPTGTATPPPPPTRAPRLTATATETPNAATAAAVIARLVGVPSPTPPEGIPGARATLAVLATRIAGGPSAAGAAAGPTADADGGGTGLAGGAAQLVTAVTDHLGLAFLGLAAFVGGLWFTAGRTRPPAP
jgi:hypothetical protein